MVRAGDGYKVRHCGGGGLNYSSFGLGYNALSYYTCGRIYIWQIT